MEVTNHPQDPPSNVAKFSGYDPDKYVITDVMRSVVTDECFTPGGPPRLTQNSIGKYLRPTTYELDEVPNAPTIDEVSEAVIDGMLKKDRAFWVDKPGANAYTLHDAFYKYGMTTEIVKPSKQDVFPRSYQYDLDCVKFRRLHACDGLKLPEESRTKHLCAHCRNCARLDIPARTPFQLAWLPDPSQKRWRDYPNLTEPMSPQLLRDYMMKSVGRPFKNEACNWYYENYPPVKYDCIQRKFSK